MSHTAVLTDTTWFRCKVSCGSSFSYSTSKQIIKRPYLDCYCTSGLGGGCTSTYIDSVALGGTSLANGGTGCAGNSFVQYPAAPGTCAQLAPAQTYSLHTVFGGAVNASVWIDYDQSGGFDSSEWSLICSSCLADSDYVTALAVPSNAKNGLTRMRLRTRATGNANSYADACTTFGSGETEDYFIGINYPVGIGVQATGDYIIFPNPARQEVSLAGLIPAGEEIVVQVYAADGSLLKEFKAQYRGLLSFDVTDLMPGAYFIRLQGSRPYPVKKLLIVR
jgi:hypothetical protein